MDELNAIASLYSKNASKSSDGTVLIEGRTLTSSEKVAIDAEVIRLQAEFDAQAYARDRRAEYDALNQLEMQFDDKEDGTTTWEDAIKAIKTKYPKP